MSKWEMVKLSDCIRLSSGKFLPMKKRINGEYDVFGGNGVTGKHNEYFIENPTIVIGRVGEYCGCVHVTSEKAWITDNALYVTNFLKDIDIDYFSYVLNNKNLNKYANKSGQPSISQSTILNIEIPLPPLETQKQIAKTLDTASELINLRKKQLEELDNLIKAVFYDMFGDPVTNEKGWKEVRLADISENFIGLTYKPEDVSDTGVIVLRSSNIQNGRLDFIDIVRVAKEIKDKLYVKDGDILMCSRNGSARLVGKVALIKDLKEPMTFGAFMTIIRSQYRHYLMTYFETEGFRRQIVSGATTTVNQITKAMLDRVVLPLPPLPLQTKFAEIVSKIEEQKAVIQISIDESQYLFDSLMSKYFD